MSTENAKPLNNKQRELPADFSLTPPLIQNPLIGIHQSDTLTNVSYCLTLLGDLSLYEDACFSGDASRGFYHLMECVNRALRFEIDHRDGLRTRSKL